MLLIDPAKYVKAAAIKTDLHCFKFSLGTYFLRIGSALLKLASVSFGKVIKCTKTLVERHPIIIRIKDK